MLGLHAKIKSKLPKVMSKIESEPDLDFHASLLISGRVKVA